jgi:cob(I)alamin adenosyltransferase
VLLFSSGSTGPRKAILLDEARLLHVARTVARRAERSVWAAIEAYGTTPEGGVNPVTATYLNRLSDLLFVLARTLNRAAGRPDVLWQKGRDIGG